MRAIASSPVVRSEPPKMQSATWGRGQKEMRPRRAQVVQLHDSDIVHLIPLLCDAAAASRASSEEGESSSTESDRQAAKACWRPFVDEMAAVVSV